jgi:sigma-B regulation protein RsbU (phosphoserine phosphatase)
MSLLPEPNVNFGRADISLGLRSSGYVGGDLVGYFKINENQVGLFGLDVSGSWRIERVDDGAPCGVSLGW